jgi:hypothetical protein
MRVREHRDGHPGSPALADADVEKARRLRRRRREWALTAAGSLAGLVAYFAVGLTFFRGLAGTLAVISVVPVFVLLGLIPAALVVVLVDTVRLRHLDAAIRAAASNGLLDAALDNLPRRRRPAQLSGWVVAGCLAFAAVVYLPNQVAGVAYLAEAGQRETFVPVSYSQVCGKGGCATVTDGILAETGADVTWPGQVPLDRSFTVRSPAWASEPGSELIPGTSAAWGRVILGLFFDVLAAVMVLAATPWARHRLARLAYGKRKRALPGAAGLSA